MKLGPDFECRPRPDDPTGYLQPICRYMADNFKTYPVDPNTLTITIVIPGNEQKMFNLPEYSTADFDFAGLSCCYGGDWAVVEVATKTVVAFHPGDK